MSPLLIDEMTVGPGTAYGISKYAIELLADRLGRRYQIPTACMRYTYVQGPRNSFHNPYSGVARRFVLRLLDGLPPIIYEDGEQLRDYVNVRDVAHANLLVLEDERSDFKVFNVGGGRATPVHTVAEILIAEFGSALRADVPGEFRVGDTRHTVSDISALQSLGWTPTISLEESLGEYVAWVRQQGGATGRIEETERIMRDQGVIQRATQSDSGCASESSAVESSATEELWSFTSPRRTRWLWSPMLTKTVPRKRAGSWSAPGRLAGKTSSRTTTSTLSW